MFARLPRRPKNKALAFQELVERAASSAALCRAWAQPLRRSWENDEIALAFVGDAGNLQVARDLARLVIAHNGVRDIPDIQEKLAHELCDCLWSIIVLARNYNVDLASAFLANMDALTALSEQQ